MQLTEYPRIFKYSSRPKLTGENNCVALSKFDVYSIYSRQEILSISRTCFELILNWKQFNEMHYGCLRLSRVGVVPKFIDVFVLSYVNKHIHDDSFQDWKICQ